MHADEQTEQKLSEFSKSMHDLQEPRDRVQERQVDHRRLRLDLFSLTKAGLRSRAALSARTVFGFGTILHIGRIFRALAGPRARPQRVVLVLELGHRQLREARLDLRPLVRGLLEELPQQPLLAACPHVPRAALALAFLEHDVLIVALACGLCPKTAADPLPRKRLLRQPIVHEPEERLLLLLVPLAVLSNLHWSENALTGVQRGICGCSSFTKIGRRIIFVKIKRI